VKLLCAGCGGQIDAPEGFVPASERHWHGDACWELWLAANPEEAKHWVAVSDLTPVQRAELDGVLGKAALA